MDSWLLGSNSGRILSPASLLSEDATVDQLLDSESRQIQFFLPFDAQLIKSIPMCYSAQEDFLFWPHSQTGLYQVRLGYKMLCELSSGELASSSDAVGEEKKFQSSLWKLIVPNKVKSFLWRASTNSILTMQNLHKRKVASSSICSLYNEKESTIHDLWSHYKKNAYQ